MLDEMVARGGITRRRRNDEEQYALLPPVLWGMFEHQIKMLTPSYLGNLGEYMQNEFGAELARGVLPRSRYIPVEESVDTDTRVAGSPERKPSR